MKRTPRKTKKAISHEWESIKDACTASYISIPGYVTKIHLFKNSGIPNNFPEMSNLNHTGRVYGLQLTQDSNAPPGHSRSPG